jgi:hypothetical protein
VFTSNTYQCTKCNTQRQRIKILEQGIDSVTGNPYGLMELECGHVERVFRVTKVVDIAPLFGKTQKVTLEPQVVNGTPSLSVSGGGKSFIGGSVNIDFRGNKVDNIIMNISNTNIQASTANLDQSRPKFDIAFEYNAIKQQIASDTSNKDDREEIILMLEEIKNELKSKQIPYSKLDRLKRYEKAYYMTLPWVMKALDLIIRTGSVNL